MIINSINISSFGCFKNKEIFFTKGLNLVYGENENGKTTIMSFIKMMFYGNERNTQDLAKNPRKKYAPWDGTPMAGSVTFTHKNRNYRLEKEFKGSNSTDKTVLYDLDLGERTSAPSDIGSSIFGLSSQAFDRTIFIGQLGYLDKNSDAEGEINSRLSNIVNTGDESVSYQTVSSRLEKVKYSLMSKRGQAGEYDKNMKQLSDLKALKEHYVDSQRSYLEQKSEGIKITDEINQARLKALELKDKIDKEQEFRLLDKLKLMVELKDKLDSLNKTLQLSDGTVIDEVYVKKIEFCLSKIQITEQKLADKTNQVNKLIDSIDNIENDQNDVSEKSINILKDEVEDLKSQQDKYFAQAEIINRQYDNYISNSIKVHSEKKKINIIFLIPSVISLIISALLMFFYLPIGLILLAVSLILLILSISFRPLNKHKIKQYEEELSALQRDKETLKSVLDDLDSKYQDKLLKYDTLKSAFNSNSSLLEYQKNLLTDSQKEFDITKTEYQSQLNQLFSIYNRYQFSNSIDEIKNGLDNLKLKANQQKELKQQINFVIKDVGNITYDEAKQRLLKLQSYSSDLDFKTIRQSYDSILESISNKKSELSAIAVKMKLFAKESENIEQLNSDIKKLEEITIQQKQFCKETDIAIQVLSDSYIQLRNSYSTVLQNKSEKIFSGITNGKYKNMIISNDFNINVEQTDLFGSKQLDFLSGGTVDQAYLSLRLAISDLISDSDEKLPIFLDDSLSQYDDTRTLTAINYLQSYSQNGQLILFSCHKNVLSMAEKMTASIINL